jgi:hypothetical protein
MGGKRLPSLSRPRATLDAIAFENETGRDGHVGGFKRRCRLSGILPEPDPLTSGRAVIN